MHRVSPKPFYVDAMVVEHMPIKAIIVPHFQVLLILQIRLKVIDQACIFAKIIDKHTRPSSEIILRTSVERSTYYFPLANWSLLFSI